MSVSRFVKKLLQKMKKEVRVPVYIPSIQSKLLENKYIIITGGTGDIGFAIAKACLENGASVLITGRNNEKLQRAACKLSHFLTLENQKIDIFELDINQEKSIERINNDVFMNKDFPTIDALVNNAGVSSGSVIGSTSFNDFDQTINTNLKGTYFLSQYFSNYLIKNAIKGNILNISSVSGIRPAISPYMLSKWGINGLTKGLAKKLIKHNIVVNGIAPGPTATNMLNNDGSNLYYENSPSKRYVSAVEVANLAVFLLSDMGKMIVSEVINITGGCGNLTIDDIQY